MAFKVLLDTDIGSDIDDAVCLAYLLANPNCDLVGVTTVTGEPEKRAMLASALCRVAGRDDIPIYPGAAEPLLIEQRQKQAAQAEALAKWPHRSDFPQGEAVEFLRRTIRANPGEITLLAVGPLTNIGLLLRTDPEIPRLLKGFVMMGGRFTNQRAGLSPTEWNILCDPHAASIVYQNAPGLHRSIGLDVTTQVVMSAEEVRSRFAAPLLQPVLDFAQVWFRQVSAITFHDPLAATVIFNDEICQFERGQVAVELESPRLAGYTFWSPDENGPHEVAVKVSPDRFFEEYFSHF
ncbi:MAG: nucleoside hydrolase [Chloroflexi bacterium]|nr:nucleoside hydrolase [Chloroflexota bacterium]